MRALLLPLALAACAVRPTAPEVAARARALGSFDPLAVELLAQGWHRQPVPLMDAPGVGAAACVEAATGGALLGVDVVRACGAADGSVLGVWRMQTHGRPWERVEVP